MIILFTIGKISAFIEIPIENYTKIVNFYADFTAKCFSFYLSAILYTAGIDISGDVNILSRKSLRLKASVFTGNETAKNFG